MRISMLRRSLLLFALPLGAVSCASSPPPDPGSPVPAQMTDRQAAGLAGGFLDTKSVGRPRTLASEEKQQRGWWLRYVGPFDTAATPPQGSYLLEVDNDGTVHQVGG
jgi:hypothetical protein